MRLEKAISCMWSCMLSFLLSFAGITCMATAFEMTVDMKSMVLCCAAMSAVCSVCYALPLGLIPLGSMAVAGGFLWRSGSLVSSIEALLYKISRQYNRAYGWGIIRWSHNTADDMELLLTTALCIVGSLVALVVARGVCRRKSAVPGILLGSLPLAACLVITDAVPQLPWLYLLFLGMGMLMLTNGVRRQNEEQANRLTAVVALPVALALLILFAAVPQNTYTGQENARNMVDVVVNTEPIRTLMMRFSETGTSGSSADGRSVNLRAVGVRLTSKVEILRVNADYSGTLYLRGRGLDAYDGVNWTESGKSAGALGWPTGLETAGEVVIKTQYAHRMLYLPYYVRSRDMQYVNTGIENEKKLTQYSFSCWKMPDATYFNELFPTRNSSLPTKWSDQLLRQFIHLDDSVMKWAAPLAREIVGDIQSPYHKAQAIGNYVRSSAAYDTDTWRMPSGEEDFVRWFLEDSDTGYCVHFASAATVLLQAVGIPARYITGYTADVQKDQVTVVRAEDAHAWAEYWLPGFGWTVLEATPAQDMAVEGTTQQSTEGETSPNSADPEQTIASEPASKPANTANTTNTNQQKQMDATLAAVRWGVGALLLLLGIAQGQRTLRLVRRSRRYKRATVNQQAILLWGEAAGLAALLKERPAEGLWDIALRARFSQHTITQEELEKFRNYILQAQSRLKKASFCRRICYRYIHVAY